jgi:hypothetical protein
MIDVDTFLTTLYVMVDDFCQSRPRGNGPAGVGAPRDPAHRERTPLWTKQV